MRRHPASPALVALTLALAPAPARAHQAGLSYGIFSLESDRLEVALRLSASELAARWPGLADAGAVARADAGERLARAVLETVDAARGGAGCVAERAAARLEAPDGVQLSAAYRCPPGEAPLRVRLGFMGELPPGHVHLAKVVAGAQVRELVLDAQHQAFDVEARTSIWARAARFGALGVEHIFTGWDHLAFLFGLLLAGGGWREIARVVTGFTAAHALTLALATLGVVAPPPAVVEPLIAASVAYVGLENLLRLRRPAGGTRRRWPVAFAFGLVHGFGFAGALRELHLARAGLAVALLSFNVGVELGQAAIVATALPLLALVRRRPSLGPAATPAGSIAVVAAGLFWLVQRVPW